MAPDRPLTTSEAAAGLGVSRSTIKNWIREFSLGAARDARGDWRIDPDTLPIFEEVKRLRDEGLGLESIRRVIGVATPQDAWRAERSAQPAQPQVRPGMITRFMEPGEVPPRAAQELTHRPGAELAQRPSHELAHRPPSDVGFREPVGMVPHDHELAMQTMAAAVESQERLAMQMARLAHANGQLQAQLKFVGAEMPRLQQDLEAAAARSAELTAQVEELETHKQGTEFELVELTQELGRLTTRIAELEGELVTARAQIEELTKNQARPRSGMHYHFAAPNEEAVNQQLLELQRELIKSKERIAAHEAAEYARIEARRPWWNFWD